MNGVGHGAVSDLIVALWWNRRRDNPVMMRME
jgi:hypothetical protein